MISYLNSLVNKVYIISSPLTTDRIPRLKKMLKSLGIYYTMYIAPCQSNFLDYSTTEKDLWVGRGSQSLLMANYNIIDFCKSTNVNSVCILEDDVIFEDEFESDIIDFSMNTPNDWQILNLGYHEESKINFSSKFSHKFSEQDNVVASHAVCYNRDVYNDVLNAIKSDNVPMDWVLRRNIYHKTRSYGPVKVLARQLSHRQHMNQEGKLYKSTICY